MAKQKAKLDGSLFLLTGDDQSFAQAQYTLLQAIDECGSISAAAKKVGISYKTAWDRIDAMNNMSDRPLVVRTAGGAQGGGTCLTELGRDIAQGFAALQEEHQVFIQRLGARLRSLPDIAQFIHSGTIRASARNQLRGTVMRLDLGTSNSTVIVEVGQGQPLVALISEEGRKWLGLREGDAVVALIKSSWVMLSLDLDFKSSAQNRFVGTVIRINRGAVNSEVVLDIGLAKTLVANITNVSVDELDLKIGTSAAAFFKASSVILMADKLEVGVNLPLQE